MIKYFIIIGINAIFTYITISPLLIFIKPNYSGSGVEPFLVPVAGFIAFPFLVLINVSTYKFIERILKIEILSNSQLYLISLTISSLIIIWFPLYLIFYQFLRLFSK